MIVAVIAPAIAGSNVPRLLSVMPIPLHVPPEEAAVN